MTLEELQFKSSVRARRLRIAVYRNGRVVVIKPKRMPEAIARAFVFAKRRWIEMQIAKLAKLPEQAALPSTRKDFLAYKEAARELAHERLAFFNSHYGFTFRRVSIKNTKTRWGSCSKKGNLNFNFKIALLPPYLADYIIVHELCHLTHLDHGREFWNRVRETIPDYTLRRREIKQRYHA